MNVSKIVALLIMKKKLVKIIVTKNKLNLKKMVLLIV